MGGEQSGRLGVIGVGAMMPRFHPHSTSVRFAGGHGARPRRIRVTDQETYWRHVVSKLYASAVGAYQGQFILQSPVTPQIAQTGPMGTGERWTVDLVHVNASLLYGQAPFVVQQIAAQDAGTTVTPPPPIVAQVWHTIGGTNVTLLGQTTQGGSDALAIAAELEQGHQLTVMWFGLAATIFTIGTNTWFTATGTRYTLGP